MSHPHGPARDRRAPGRTTPQRGPPSRETPWPTAGGTRWSCGRVVEQSSCGHAETNLRTVEKDGMANRNSTRARAEPPVFSRHRLAGSILRRKPDVRYCQISQPWPGNRLGPSSSGRRRAATPPKDPGRVIIGAALAEPYRGRFYLHAWVRGRLAALRRGAGLTGVTSASPRIPDRRLLRRVSRRTGCRPCPRAPSRAAASGQAQPPRKPAEPRVPRVPRRARP